MNDTPLLRFLRTRISPQAKTAFLSCLILGFVTHLFAFTNIIPNSDGLDRIFDPQQMTVSGRWFLHYASMFHGYIQAPSLIGALSLVFLGAAAGMTADLLHLDSPVSSALIGGVMALFPAVAYTYLYMFTASAYAFAIMLAVLAVWITRRFPKGMGFAALILACSIGTYQAYFAAAAALALVCVILDLLNPDKDPGETIHDGFRILGMLALSAVLYYGILQLFLLVKDVELLTYKGMDETGSMLSFGGILGMILETYRSFLYFFLSAGSFGYNTRPLILANLMLIGISVWSVFQSLLEEKQLRSPIRILLLLAGAALMPLACNFSQLLSDSTHIMRYGFTMAYVLMIALCDRVLFRNPKLSRCLKISAMAAMMTALLVFAQISNIAYTASATAHRATERFSTNLVGRVESLPGYEHGMEVVIIGSFPDEVYYSDVEAFQLVEHYSCMSATVMQLNKHVYQYLNHWMNVPWAEPEEKTFLLISESEAFRSMPLYPSDGSVQILDGRVIVRLAEEYVPKKDYELAYENRK